MPTATQQRCIACAAQRIHEGFEQYDRQFRRITHRARQRFEQRDWKGQMADIAARIELYEYWVKRTVKALKKDLGDDLNDHAIWPELREYYGLRISAMPDAGFMKTFFNSITRRVFATRGVDRSVEFVQPPPEEGLESLVMRRYPAWNDLDSNCARILKDFRFRHAYAKPADDAGVMAQAIRNALGEDADARCLRFEFIDTHFFQSTRAYLVGRIRLADHTQPIVIALRNDRDGIHVDAVLLNTEQIGVVFSYTRSYYFADPTSVVAAVQFLHDILPSKPIDELYTVLGRLRQGKTERYRSLMSHLKQTNDPIVHAPGEAGLVMIVFTVPSFNLVFKVMRDIFRPPKTTTQEDVHQSYRLVSKHDHAGRLIDTQHFRNLELPRARFSEQLQAELFDQAPQTVGIDGDSLVFGHAYVERRVRPLNLYVREVDETEAERVILDYGQCLKDLAETNIFAGDLLLKNFGVTSSGRVLFYDYDEVMLVTDCNFYELPEPDDDYPLMDYSTHHFVSANAIFPEEFIRFLALPSQLRQTFMQKHKDLLTASYWRDVKQRLQAGEVAEIVPYERQSTAAQRIRL